jgi:hypothetical protein
MTISDFSFNAVHIPDEFLIAFFQLGTTDSQPLMLDANIFANVNSSGFKSTVSFSNGFNGGYEGFENIYQINEYRCLFGIQYTNTGGTTTVTVPVNFSTYTGYTGGSISITSAANQPYGVMIYPGVQNNKQLSTKYYYSGNSIV